MRKTILIASACIVAGAAIFFLSGLMIKKPPQAELKRVPDLVFYDHEGKEVLLVNTRGKPLIISSWASWCPRCYDGMPDFYKLREEFGGKLEIILVNRGEDTKVASGTLEVLDPNDSFYKAIGGFSMPETIFVNKDGFIVVHKRGAMNFEEIKRRVEDVFGL